MNNKYLRFLLLDHTIRIRVAIFLALWILISFQGGTLKTQGKELSRIKTEKELVLKIPNMEKTIKAHTIIATEMAAPGDGTQSGEQIVKVEFILKGMTIKNGIPYALIDENIYKEGDTLGEYAIMKISRAGVVMQNNLTQEIKQLYFIEPPQAPVPPAPAK